jgi:hypothetical protein
VYQQYEWEGVQMIWPNAVHPVMFDSFEILRWTSIYRRFHGDLMNITWYGYGVVPMVYLEYGLKK